MKFFLIGLFISGSITAIAQIRPIPIKVQDLFDNSVETFSIYQGKTPAEIYDGSYDESEFELFNGINSVKSFEQIGIINQDEYMNFKISLLDSAANIFTIEQLESIILVTKESVMISAFSNISKTELFFSLALKYKNKSLKTKKIIKALKNL